MFADFSYINIIQFVILHYYHSKPLNKGPEMKKALTTGLVYV